MSRPDDDREIADASFLFDAPKDEQPQSDRAGRRPGSREPGPQDEDLGIYDLAEPPPSGQQARPPLPIDEPPGAPADVPRPGRPDPATARPKELTPAPVLKPWTRMAEWGPTLVRVAVALAIVFVLVYATFSFERLAISLLILAAGMSVVVLLSYPIAITLERPVRMTPEHAVRDYFGSLAHHVPHLRRMWLLLSSAGHAAPEFGSYDAFRSYWGTRIKELKREGAGGFTPLSVRIDDFTSDKSAGQDAVEASYTLSISLRGKEDQGPLYSQRLEAALSRGPDRMWYLDDGRLPR